MNRAAKKIHSSLGVALGCAAALAALAPTVRAASPAAKGLFRALTKKDASYKLKAVKSASDASPKSITVTVKGARKVGAADVARLAWDCGEGACVLNGLPEQVAVSDKGVWLLDGDASDDDVKAAIAKAPAFADPPRAAKAYSRKDGRFAFSPAGSPGTSCIGVNAPKPEAGEEGCGAAPCYEWLCVDATGLVGVGGLGEGDEYGLTLKVPEAGGH